MFSQFRTLFVAVACSTIALVATAVPAVGASASTLPAPDNFRVADTGFDEITLAWDRVPGAEFYRVLVNGAWRAGTYDPEHSAEVIQLQPGVTYTFEVQAQETGGEFGPSATLTAATLADNEPPSIPTDLREALDTSGKSIGPTWNPSTDNWGVLKYLIYADGRFVMYGGTLIQWYWLTDPYHGALSCITTYVFTVRAMDKNGNLSAHSDPLTATTPACPQKASAGSSS